MNHTHHSGLFCLRGRSWSPAWYRSGWHHRSSRLFREGETQSKKVWIRITAARRRCSLCLCFSCSRGTQRPRRRVGAVALFVGLGRSRASEERWMGTGGGRGGTLDSQATSDSLMN